jgi:signal transduction histidine kinase
VAGRVKQGAILGALLLLAVGILLVDLYIFPGIVLPAIVYALPIIAAAFLLPPEMVAGLSVCAVVLQGADGWLERPPLWLFSLDVVGVAAFGVLATLLAARMEWESGLAARAQAAASEADVERGRLQAVLQQMPAGVVIAEAPSGRLILASDRTEQIWRRRFHPGVGPEGYGGGNVFRMDGSPYPPDEVPLTRSLERGEVISGEEVRILRGDDTWAVVRINSGPIRNEEGRIVAAVVAFDDITRLHDLQERREDDVRMISHDLRTPLTPITGQASLLQRLLAERGMEREAASAEAIVKSAERMNSMIQELVESARLETGTLELHEEPTEPCPFIRDLSGRMGTAEEGARLRVECGGELPAVPIDRERIERVIGNLVTNAFKYSPPTAPVVVRVERREGTVVFSVSDRGVGIPPDELPHVFERLYRARTGKAAEGLGLGLYISRLIVEAHGGHIWAESRPGEGSTFSFSLPIPDGR